MTRIGLYESRWNAQAESECSKARSADGTVGRQRGIIYFLIYFKKS
jgi:hypothetical protein